LTLADVATADRFVDLAGLLETCEVDGFRADFLSWGHYRPEYWRNYWHTHSFHEVCLAYSGEGRFNSGSALYDVTPGSVFLARPGDVHEIESSHSSPLGIAFWGFTFRPGSLEPGWWSGLTRADGPVMSDRVGSLPELISALSAGSTSRAVGQEAAAAVKPVRAEKLPNVPGKTLTAVVVSSRPAASPSRTSTPEAFSLTCS